MSRVKIEGNATGSGTLTISAPNTNTDRSLTLPDEAGEVLINGTSSNVGIGTNSPITNLTLGTGTTGVSFKSGSTSFNSGKIAVIKPIEVGSGNGHLVFETYEGGSGGSERMRITSSGRVGINETSPSTIFQVSYNSINDGAVIFANDTGSDTNQRTSIDFQRNGSTVGRIRTTTTATVYDTSSDYRLKENVVDMDGAIERVKALSPKRFNFIADADTTVDGFIAHEVSDVVPEATTGEKDATQEEEYEVTPAVLDDDGNVVTEAVMGTRTVPDYQGIDQSKLVPLLTGALQEAIDKIEALETRIEALENA